MMLSNDVVFLKRLLILVVTLLVVLAWWANAEYNTERKFLLRMESSPNGERIAFDSVIDGKIKLVLMDADGEHVKYRWNSKLLIPQSPDLSPDNTQIAFMDNTRDIPHWQIFVMDSDGNNLRQITNVEGIADYPHWSPDGRSIAFHVSYNDTLWLNMVNLETQTVRSFGKGRFPDWSPDSQQIVYFDKNNLYLVTVDTTETVSLGEGIYPHWSPDGSRIVYWTSQGGIFTIDPNGENRQQLTTIGEMPVWSPDGNRIAFREYPSEIWVMNADGSNPHRLYDQAPFSFLMKPFWSGDGESIFMPTSDQELLRINADTGGIEDHFSVERLLSPLPFYMSLPIAILIAILLVSAWVLIMRQMRIVSRLQTNKTIQMNFQ